MIMYDRRFYIKKSVKSISSKAVPKHYKLTDCQFIKNYFSQVILILPQLVFIQIISSNNTNHKNNSEKTTNYLFISEMC